MSNRMQCCVLSFVVVLVGSLGISFAQEKITEKTLHGPVSKSAEKPSEKWCDVYLMEDSPKDVLVFNQDGVLMQDARQVYLWFQIATQQPQAKIYRWPGLYRPANASEENWDVRHVRMVDSAEFMKLAETGNLGR